MSNNNNGAPQGGNPFAGGATYQSIIIALVAGGVLSTGLVTLVWRRRRYRELEREMDRAVRDGRERYRSRREREERDRLASEGKGAVLVPKIWDVVVGEKPVISKSLDEATTEKRHQVEQTRISDEKHALPSELEEQGELDVDGMRETGWSPTTVAFLRTGPSGIQSRVSYAAAPTVAEVSVLIAMPFDDPSRRPYLGDIGSPITPNTPLPPYYDPSTTPRCRTGPDPYPTLHTIPPDTEDFPPLQLATTAAPITAGTMAEREELDRLVLESEWSRERAKNPAVNGGVGLRPGDGFRGNVGGSSAGDAAGTPPASNPGRRVERVDGFRE